MNKQLLTRIASSLTLCALAFAGLNGCGGSGSTIGANGSGTINVHMSDGAGTGITAVNITISKIDANINGQWQTVSTATQSFNLLDLVTQDAVIGSATLPAGNYTQIRLLVDSATVTDSTGTHPLVIPSGSQTGIKVNVNFPINPNDVTDVLLDFNVAQSIIIQGNGTYKLKPVIPAVVMVLSGTATGTVSDAGGVVNGAAVTATYTAGPNYPVGTVVNTTTTMSDGTFKVWALLPGTYDFTFSFTNPNTSTTETATVTDVAITANQNTDLGSVMLQ